MASEDGFRLDGNPMGRLKAEARSLADALGDRAISSLRANVENAVSRLTQYVEGGGGPGLTAAAFGAKGPAEGRSPRLSGPASATVAASHKADGLGRREGGRHPRPPDRVRAAGHGRTTTDHEEIRRWVMKHGGRPVSVKGTERHGEKAGILRVNFPGSPADESFNQISWNAFFDKFEASQLAFVYQDATADGQESRFGKFISRWRPR